MGQWEAATAVAAAMKTVAAAAVRWAVLLTQELVTVEGRSLPVWVLKALPLWTCMWGAIHSWVQLAILLLAG
jgi:hypothetical protein